MTKAEILAMKPGPELDALVGNDVMEWGRGAWRPFEDIAPGLKRSEQFRPSTRLYDAWEVVEKMNSPYIIASTEDGDQSWVHFGNEANAAVGEVTEAICKAALIAKLSKD